MDWSISVAIASMSIGLVALAGIAVWSCRRGTPNQTLVYMVQDLVNALKRSIIDKQQTQWRKPPEKLQGLEKDEMLDEPEETGVY